VSFHPAERHDMANDEIHEVASLYSLGLLEPELAAGFERHLEGGCSVCESEVRGFSDTAAQVLESLAYAEPPERLREELMKRVSLSVPASVLHRSGEGEWRDAGIAGITRKQLFVDPSTGNITSLLRMTAGTLYPPHRHSGLEHCYVLEGDLVFDDHTLHAGDYEVSSQSTEHSPATTKHGCLLLIINNQRDQLHA
jgi:anti-sigma factor ChrR (cupin superfamily)